VREFDSNGLWGTTCELHPSVVDWTEHRSVLDERGFVTGPPLTGKRRLGREILRHGMAAGEGAIVISTHDSAERVEEVFASASGDDDLLVSSTASPNT